MKYKNIIFISLLVMGSLFYTWYTANLPKSLDWSETYSPEGKMPYDTYIISRNLSYLFPESPVISSRRLLLEQLEAMPEDKLVNYIFINRVFQVDAVELGELLKFVKKGHSLFIGAEHISDSLLSFLGLEQERVYVSEEHCFTHSDLSSKRYVFDKVSCAYFIPRKDFRGRILGVLKERNVPDFVMVPCGKGNVYLNLNPRAFTNYGVLDSVQGDYYYKALSYLPDEGGPVVWDTYQVLGAKGNTSLFRVLLKHTPLRFAFYLLVLGGMLYAAFCVRREQRPIPVILPGENKMLDFVASVSSLYYKQKDHYGIADKRIEFFLEKVRSHYKIRTDELDAGFIQALSECSGKDKETVAWVVRMIITIRRTKSLHEQGLRELVKKMDSFPFYDLVKK